MLVNNAGITRDGMFRKMTRADWDAVIETNLTSLFNVTKQVIDDMVERGWGRIINISFGERREGPVRPDQLLGRQGRHARLHDGAGAGGGEQGRHRQHRRARATSRTDMVKAIRQDVLDKIIAGIPVKRLGTPDDIASIVSWVASDESGFATGADFSVNGGLHMG